MTGRHHWLNGHGFGWTLGVGDGQGGLACCGSWGRKESDTTEGLNWIEYSSCNLASCLLCNLWWTNRVNLRYLILLVWMLTSMYRCKSFFFLNTEKKNKGEYLLTMYHLINVFETHIILFEILLCLQYTMKGMTSSLLDRERYYQGFPILWSDQIRSDFMQWKLLGLLEINECDQGITTLRISAGFVILHILWGWKIGMD